MTRLQIARKTGDELWRVAGAEPFFVGGVVDEVIRADVALLGPPQDGRQIVGHVVAVALAQPELRGRLHRGRRVRGRRRRLVLWQDVSKFAQVARPIPALITGGVDHVGREHPTVLRPLAHRLEIGRLVVAPVAAKDVGLTHRAPVPDWLLGTSEPNKSESSTGR